eukprot:TRINITY_DN8241_c0_g1_i1.p1 TRINITY_DN8241_c0_g1~~TRINITY_DN8241_c0_g1_i1.p1  ORF type:complete len:180 (-),score=41.26 TRINITY_DN8241_c0_g1_i1:11-550(-)
MRIGMINITNTTMIIYIILMFIYFPLSSNGLRWKVNDPQSTNWANLASFSFYGNKEEIKEFYEVAKPILQITDMRNCNPKNYMNVNGSITIMRFGGGCSTEKHIEIAQKQGAVGVIIITDILYFCNLKDRKSSSYKNTIPALCIEVKNTETKKLVNAIYDNKDGLGVLIDFKSGKKIKK